MWLWEESLLLSTIYFERKKSNIQVDSERLSIATEMHTKMNSSFSKQARDYIVSYHLLVHTNDDVNDSVIRVREVMILLLREWRNCEKHTKLTITQCILIANLLKLLLNVKRQILLKMHRQRWLLEQCVKVRYWSNTRK